MTMHLLRLCLVAIYVAPCSSAGQGADRTVDYKAETWRRTGSAGLGGACVRLLQVSLVSTA